MCGPIFLQPSGVGTSGPSCLIQQHAHSQHRWRQELIYEPKHSGKHQPPPSWGPLRLQPLSGLREPPLSWLLASRWTVTYSQAVCFQWPLSTCSQHTEESLSLPGIPPHHSHTQALAYRVYPERTSYILDTGPDLEHTALTSRHRTLECGG